MPELMDSFDRCQDLRDGMRELDWLPADLWVASVAVGGRLHLVDVAGITSGLRRPSRAEYNMLAVALNERYMDLGANHPIAYWDLPSEP